MGYYVVCPFYLSDSRNSITCEDCIRLFPSKKEKRKHLREYCECIHNYKSCKWASDLLNLYKEFEDMDMTKEQRELKSAIHIAQANARENESLRLQIGHLNAKIKSLEMMCGYLSSVALDFSSDNEAKIDIQKMSEFFGKFEVNWTRNNNQFIYVKKKPKETS